MELGIKRFLKKHPESAVNATVMGLVASAAVSAVLFAPGNSAQSKPNKVSASAPTPPSPETARPIGETIFRFTEPEDGPVCRIYDIDQRWGDCTGSTDGGHWTTVPDALSDNGECVILFGSDASKRFGLASNCPKDELETMFPGTKIVAQNP